MKKDIMKYYYNKYIQGTPEDLEKSLETWKEAYIDAITEGNKKRQEQAAARIGLIIAAKMNKNLY